MNLGILLWNTCNIKCSHCAVNSSPTEVGFMTDEQIFELIDGAFYDCNAPKIGLSGGEAFLYFDRLCRIIKYAKSKGALVSVNTNGFWARGKQQALDKARELKSIGLDMLVVSTDSFHEEYLSAERAARAIRACVESGLEVELQYVVTKSSKRLADFLTEFGDEVMNVKCREIPCHPVGRARAEIPEDDLFFEPSVPQGLCPSGILSISAFGKVIPCCNTAGHLPALEIGTIDEPLPELHKRFLSDPVTQVLARRGPKAFYEHAIESGYSPNSKGYIDQCHLCFELFRNQSVAESLQQAAEDILVDTLYDEFRAHCESSHDTDQLTNA